ncbi:MULTISPECIES: hypothetical protein [unclassified Mesorhizobium]|uniref:hypothetical protein n=1 Tax=unclassified Mesorhizobium TaxID=325217 RepID=UPI00333CC46B
MRSFVFASLTVAATITALPLNAAPKKDILAVAERLNKVENPSEIDRWWTSVINTDEGKFVLDIVATYFGYPGGGTAVVEGIDAIVGPHRDEGNQHWGTIQAPVGYTVCTAFVRDPSLNCNGTFSGTLRTADHPDSGRIDGLHWYMVVPRPHEVGGGRCWVDGTVVVTFVRAEKKPQFQCHPVNGAREFAYGK